MQQPDSDPKDWPDRSAMWHLLKGTCERWNKDDAGMMAAAVAYYVSLSLLPTLLLLAAGLGLFLKWTNSGHEAHDYILTLVSERADASLADSIEHALTDVEELAIYGGPLGVLTLLLASLAIFAQLDRAFDRIYRVPAQERSNILSSVFSVLRYRLRAFTMLIGLGAAIITIFCAGLAFSWFQCHATAHLPATLRVWSVLEAVVEVALNSCIFAAFYRLVPKVPVRWRHAFAGGLLAAIIWEFGRQLLGTFFIGQRYTSAYGLIGALTGMMLWGYCGIAVLFAGAEFAQVAAENAGEITPIAIRHPHKSSRLSRVSWLRLFDIAFAACLLYIASFFVLRGLQSQPLEPSSLDGEPPHAVIFSNNPALQDAAITIYRPLIEIMPRDRLYPMGSELARLANSQPTSSRH